MSKETTRKGRRNTKRITSEPNQMNKDAFTLGKNIETAKLEKLFDCKK